METIKFSIICPVYNSESFLSECIESVIKQNYQNWELILVNDGSTDGSTRICKAFSQKDARIVLINQENRGQFIARLNAIKIISGAYVLFLDSDDKLSKNALSTLYSILSSKPVDIVWFSYFSSQNQIDNPYYFTDDDIIEIGNPVEELFGKRIGFFLWDKCFSKKLFVELDPMVNFNFSNFAEDTLMVYFLSKAANTIRIINKKLYYYRYNEQSKVHNISKIDKIGRDYIYSYIYANVSQLININSKIYDVYVKKYLDLVFKTIIFIENDKYKKEINYIFYNYNKFFRINIESYLKSNKQKFVFWLYSKKRFFSARIIGRIILKSI